MHAPCNAPHGGFGRLCYLAAKSIRSRCMKHPVLPFALASLPPVLFLTIGTFNGGLWLWAAALYTSFFAFGLDEALAMASRDGAPGSTERAANRLSVVLALAHLALIPLGVATVSGATGLGMLEQVLAFFGFGLFFGQVSNSNAHELIHRSQKALFGLGKWVYISMLYGHHTTAHRLLHHAHVATPLDPNFPPKGRSFYAYFPRGWVRSFTRGYAVERARAARAGRMNPYVEYVGGRFGLCAGALGWLLGARAFWPIWACAFTRNRNWRWWITCNITGWRGASGPMAAMSRRRFTIAGTARIGSRRI